MSIQSIQSKISSLQREIQSLQRNLTNESKNEATKTNRIVQINQSITRTTSLSTIESKQREKQRLENDLARIQQKKADLTKRIADKTAQLHKSQQDLYKEQEKDQRKFQESLKRKEREQKRRQEQLLERLRTMPHEVESATRVATPEQQDPTYDVFVSYASDDKDDLVRPLVEALNKKGYSVWYAEFKLRIGDSLRRSIDKGLAHSKFGIVVLSPSFFAKNWTQYELDGLVAKEMTGGKVILPIWHKVSKDEVMAYSPALADKFALNTAMYSIEELAKELGEVLKDT